MPCDPGGGGAGGRSGVPAGFFPVSTAVRMKRRSPQMTGVAEPEPGISTFHRTFLDSLHSMGGSPLGAKPSAFGPRQWCQLLSRSFSNSSAVDENGKARRRQTAITLDI